MASPDRSRRPRRRVLLALAAFGALAACGRKGDLVPPPPPEPEAAPPPEQPGAAPG